MLIYIWSNIQRRPLYKTCMSVVFLVQTKMKEKEHFKSWTQSCHHCHWMEQLSWMRGVLFSFCLPPVASRPPLVPWKNRVGGFINESHPVLSIIQAYFALQFFLPGQHVHSFLCSFCLLVLRTVQQALDLQALKYKWWQQSEWSVEDESCIAHRMGK